MDTKEKILKQALGLFARQGYQATSVGEIAQAVGIKAPSLYKHYESKQAILRAIVGRMEEGYARQAALLQMDGANPGQDGPMFGGLSEDQLVQKVLGLFTWFRTDPWNSAFRRMLTVEQFRDQELSGLFSRLYLDDPLGYQSALFSMLGLGEPDVLALQFYGPIYLMLSLCDRAPERTREAEEKLQLHVRRFYQALQRGGSK